MADVMRLTAGGNTVNLSPREGYEAPEERRRSVHRALDGSLFIYEFGNKNRYEIPVNNISSADQGYIETWWQDRTKVTFYPDFANNPGTSIYIRVINEDSPLQLMSSKYWQDKYEGTLILRQVSA